MVGTLWRLAGNKTRCRLATEAGHERPCRQISFPCQIDIGTRCTHADRGRPGACSMAALDQRALCSREHPDRKFSAGRLLLWSIHSAYRERLKMDFDRSNFDFGNCSCDLSSTPAFATG